MITKEEFQEIINNFGKNGDKAWFIINKHQHYIATAKDENDIPLLAYAIQFNDGGNISYLLSLGADMNTPIKNGTNITCYEYAKQYANYNGREPYAFEALNSFKNIKDNLKIEILPDNVFDTTSSIQQSWIENARNKKDNELVSLYHGAKTNGVNQDVINSFEHILSTSNCIQQASGPTLSIQPLGQFWNGLGFEIKVPRHLINFPGENKEKAILSVSDDGAVLINNADKQLKFDEYQSKILLNLRACKTQGEVDAPYPSENAKVGDYNQKIVISHSIIESLNHLQAMMEINNKKLLNKNYSIDKLKTMSNISKMREKINFQPSSSQLKF